MHFQIVSFLCKDNAAGHRILTENASLTIAVLKTSKQ